MIDTFMSNFIAVICIFGGIGLVAGGVIGIVTLVFNEALHPILGLIAGLLWVAIWMTALVTIADNRREHKIIELEAPAAVATHV